MENNNWSKRSAKEALVLCILVSAARLWPPIPRSVLTPLIGRDFTTGEEAALKLEHNPVYPSSLSEEAERYIAFQNLVGFPTFYWYGQQDDFRVMAFELLGPSLKDLFEFCGGRFSTKTTVMIIDQLLSRMEDLHSRGIVHRDVKPRNFLMGTWPHSNQVYVTDFGLVSEYEAAGPGATETTETSPRKSHLVGTTLFASIRGHLGQEQSPRDDLESLGYMIVYFMQGKLPWQKLKVSHERDRDRLTMERKAELRVEDLCEGLPEELAWYFNEINSLRHGEMPKYDKLRGLFQGLGRREGVEYDNVFDWTVMLYLQQQGDKAKQ